MTRNNIIKINSFITQFKSKRKMKTINDIDYDKIFEDLDSGDLTYFKNEKMLNKYVELKNKNWKINDIKWAIYNDIKLKYEIGNSHYSLANVLSKMGSILFSEKHYSEYKQYVYAYIYCSLIPRLNTTLSLKDYEIGTVKKHDLKNMMKITNSKLNFDDYKLSIFKLIPKFYDNDVTIKIWKIILKNFE